MARITGIGGLFIKSRDPQALSRWYRDHLGVPYKDGEGASFCWDDDPKVDEGMSVFSVFSQDTKYFQPSNSSFMVNFRVDDIDGLIARLASEGVQIDPKREDADYGRFAWVYDPDGNKIELWQPLKKL
jgi:catechol 2,3-dioxygenase-like lactoylglutathione lyase family enzyme